LPLVISGRATPVFVNVFAERLERVLTSLGSLAIYLKGSGWI
jgi:hypothetical protein